MFTAIPPSNLTMPQALFWRRGATLKEVISAFVASFMSSLDQRFRLLVILVVIVLALLATIFIDWYLGFSYFLNVERRTALLKELMQLSKDDIANRPELYPIYQEIVDELGKRDTPNLVFLAGPTELLIRALSGASIWLMYIAYLLFSGAQVDNRRSMIASTIFIAVVAAAIGVVLPTVWHPIVNYVGWPIAQVLLVVVSNRGRRKTGS